MAKIQLPPLDVVSPTGERLTVSSIDDDTTVASLAGALGVRRISVGSGVLADHRRLVSIDDVRMGARLDDREPPPSRQVPRMDRTSAATDDRLEIACVAGPACSVWTPLSPGRHFVGRAPHSDLVIDDPSVELHHGIVDVSTDDAGVSTVTFTQLAGAVSARLDGEPVAAATTVREHGRLQLGSTTLMIRRRDERDAPDSHGPSGAIARHVSDPWRRVVWRAPAERHVWSPEPIDVPTRPDEPPGPAATALVGAAVAATGAVVVASVMDNAMFLVFAGVGASAALVTWLVSALVALRRRRRLRAGHRDAVANFLSAVVDLRALRRAHHRATHRAVSEALEATDSLTGSLWSSRVAPILTDDADPARADPRFDARLSAVIGTGTVRWRPSIDDPADETADDLELAAAVERAGRLHQAAAPISIAYGDTIALHGPMGSARAVARSVIVQLATWVGPADWSLVVVTAQPDLWDWADWLPHGAIRSNAVTVVDGTGRMSGDLDAIDRSRRTLVVTDEPSLFTARTGPLRRYLVASGAASLVLVDSDEVVPSMCRRVLRIGATGSATWLGDVPGDDDAVDITIAGVSVVSADRAARRLACLVDPEDDADGVGIPDSVSFTQLTGNGASLTASDIVRRWHSNGNDPAPRAALGWSSDGIVDIDLVRDGPHGLIAGTTGAGKSELLRSLVISLAVEVRPEHLNIVLVDYKGGSTFDACVELPHTVGIVTDLDDGLAERALVSLGAELHRRERLLREVGATDLTDYRTRSGVQPIARLLVVIDEFAALAKELPDFLAALVGIAQRGRSLGVHMLLATQRPAGVVNDDIRANTNLRLALRLHDRADAMDVVGDVLPSTFPRGVPGRAALRLGPDELVVFQAARCTGEAPTSVRRSITVEHRVRRSTSEPDDDLRDLVPITHEPDDFDGVASLPEGPSELDVTVRAIVAAAQMLDIAPAHRPWSEPLPFPLSAADVAAECGSATDVEEPRGAIGVVDDPEAQRRRLLRWTPEDGSLALIGSIGSGTTSTLISLAAATCRHREPSTLHLYVIDARGDDCLSALASLAHCGAVVRVTEDERLHRLLTRIVDTIDRRLAGLAPDGGATPAIVVMIDGWSGLRASVSAVERAQVNELLQRLVNDGPSVSVVTVITDAGTSASSAALSTGHRWVFHLDDASLARNFGVRIPVGPGRPGRLRVAASGLEAQVAVGAAGLAEIATSDRDDRGPEPIAVLPDRVEPSAFASAAWTSTRSPAGLNLVMGMGSETLMPDCLVVPTGDPIVVVGSPRTGVTTTLERCVTAWTDACAGEVVRVDRSHPLDPETIAGADSPMLVVVDDAHRISDDAAGTFASIIRGDLARVTLLVGARADAVRAGYGHWAREVAKARCGIVMSTRGDPDGDVLGVTVPRRPLISARPGLAWVVDSGALRQVQIALPS